MQAVKRILLLLCLAGLAACSSWQHPLPAPETTGNGPDGHWTVRGKLGVRTREGRDTLYFHWNYETPDYTLRLSAPIGGQQAIIEGHGQHVTVTLPDGSQRMAASPEALIEDIYGWQAPVSSLLWWIRGMPDPAHPGETLPPPGPDSRRLAQKGWSITWSQYRPFREAVLPGRIEASLPDGPTFIFIVQDWIWGTGEAGHGDLQP